MSIDIRVNDKIKVPEVRLIGADGSQIGVVSINKAVELAYEAGLDLVEVSPTAKPPVCKIMDFGKYKYELAQKQKEARKNQHTIVVKEQKLRPKIEEHDYNTKKNHIMRFLEAGSKVKITIMFRGREQSRPELGARLLERLATDLEGFGVVEAPAKLDGRNMTMLFAPDKNIKNNLKGSENA